MGRRVFDVEIEGQPVLVGLDVYNEVGQDAALVKRLPVTVSDSQLDIRFVHGIENPMVSAIEILGRGGVVDVVDTAAPSVPRNLSATAISSTEVELAWLASVDTGGSGLGGYRVFRDGVEIATILAPSYTDSALQPNTLYVYTVLAFDNAGNQSTPSNPPASAATVPSQPVNSPPAATNGTLIIDEDTPASGALSASDPDGDALSFSLVANGTLGSAVITDATTGAFTYLPNVGATGSDSFTFKVNDGRVDSNTATVNVTINAVNGAPVATNGSLTTNEDTAASGTLSASDADGDTLSFSVVTNGTLGSAVITNAATGAFTYTPITGASGTDSFTFQASDGQFNSNVATISVTVNPVDTEPPSVPQNLNATAISSTQINLAWVASGDTGGSGLGGYKVFRNGVEIATILAPSYTDSALQPNTLYVYTVLAFDNVGNQSTQSAPPASAATLPESGGVAYTLLVSNSRDRSSPIPLEAATIAGEVYVFTSPDVVVEEVRFFLDDPTGSGNPQRTDTLAPYDFAGTRRNGTARDFETDELADGSHVITAFVRLSDNSIVVVNAQFNIAN